MTTQRDALSSRAKWIKTHYRLEFDGTMWRAWAPYNVPCREIFGSDRYLVCRKARMEWGHFNHQDEATAFAEIFG